MPLYRENCQLGTSNVSKRELAERTRHRRENCPDGLLTVQKIAWGDMPTPQKEN